MNRYASGARWLLNWLGYLVALGACVVVANQAGEWLASAAHGGRAKASPPPPPVVPVAETLDFKEALETDAFQWGLAFQNISDRPAVLRDVRGECTCSAKVTGPREVVLAPGERAAFTITLNLFQLGHGDPADARAVEMSLFAKAGQQSGPTPEYRWALRGRVRRPLICDPPRVGFGDELICDEPGREVAIKLRPTIPVRELRLRHVPDDWKAVLLKEPAGANRYELRATPCKRKLGAFSDAFEFDLRAADGRAVPIQRVTAEGIVTDGIEVTPRPADLGTVSVGARAQTTLWVSARHGETLEAVEVVSAGSGVKVLGTRLDGSAWRVDLERAIEEPGPGTSSGTLRVKPRGKPAKETAFQLRWYGTTDAAQ